MSYHVYVYVCLQYSTASCLASNPLIACYNLSYIIVILVIAVVHLLRESPSLYLIFNVNYFYMFEI